MTAYDQAEAARGIEHSMHQADAVRVRVQERFAYIAPPEKGPPRARNPAGIFGI